MYHEGNIIYFDPFYFKNGNTPKPKYFLVLKNLGNTTILASLPSSVFHLPSSLIITHGCVNMPESGISCYIFEKNKPITIDGWSFKENTFLYGNWIDEYQISVLETMYKVKGLEYIIIGKLKMEEFNQLIQCFKASPVVKNKFRKQF